MRSVRVKIRLGAHEKFSAFKPLDLEQNRSGQSELKILVSVVRFRPGPPKNIKTTFRWFFSWGLKMGFHMVWLDLYFVHLLEFP
jgi:hypothetical protein